MAKGKHRKGIEIKGVSKHEGKRKERKGKGHKKGHKK